MPLDDPSVMEPPLEVTSTELPCAFGPFPAAVSIVTCEPSALSSAPGRITTKAVDPLTLIEPPSVTRPNGLPYTSVPLTADADTSSTELLPTHTETSRGLPN